MKKKLDVLAAALISNFKEKGLTLSLAESCSGGMIAATITDVAGASDVFLGSAVTYGNGAKETLLGISRETLEKYGAVSEECAREMASGARRVFSSDAALSVTGIAGPSGGSKEKPVGTVWFGFAAEGVCDAFFCRFEGDRAEVREYATLKALVCLIEKSGEIKPRGKV